MGTSINQDVKAGNSVYHIQTEYYKASGKIVTNIFKDGMAIKRLEKAIPNEEGIDIDEEVKAFHKSIIDRLTGKVPSVKKAAKTFLSFPEEKIDEVLNVIFPFFGIASQLTVKDALEKSQTVEEFIRNIISELPEELKEEVRKELTKILPGSKEETKTTTTSNADLEKLDMDKILTILSDYFGIAASLVFEEAVEVWKEKGGDYEILVEIIVKELEDKEAQEELRQRLLFV
ncbi:MAG: hypothetical protein ABGX27_01930 [Desulfurobacteriaceae bacterium]